MRDVAEYAEYGRVSKIVEREIEFASDDDDDEVEDDAAEGQVNGRDDLDGDDSLPRRK